MQERGEEGGSGGEKEYLCSSGANQSVNFINHNDDIIALFDLKVRVHGGSGGGGGGGGVSVWCVVGGGGAQYADWFFQVYTLVCVIRKKNRFPPVFQPTWGKLLFQNESGTLAHLRTMAASAPWRPTRASAGMLHIQSFPEQCSLEGAHHHLAGDS